METLNRYGDNHRNRDCAHGPRQVPEPARGFHADLGAAWHLNCAPGRCRRDPGPKGSSRPAQSWAARPPRPASRALRPALTTAAPHRHLRQHLSRLSLSRSSRRPALRAPPHARADPPRRPPYFSKAPSASIGRSGGARAAGLRGSALGPAPLAGSGRSRLVAPGREFERRPLIGGGREAAPAPWFGRGSRRSAAQAWRAGASLVRHRPRGLGLFGAWASLLARRQRSQPPEPMARSGLSVQVFADPPRLWP